MTLPKAVDQGRFIALAVLAAVVPLSIAGTSLIYFPLLGIWLLGAFWTFRWRSPHFGRIEKAFCVFVLVSAVSGAFGLDPTRSLRRIGRDAYFLMFLLVQTLLTSEAERRRAIRLFILGGLLASGLAVLQAAFGINKADPHVAAFLYLPKFAAGWPPVVQNTLALVHSRAPGPRSHPLTYGETLLPIFSFGLAGLAQSAVFPLANLGIVWLTGAALIASQSRGPWLAAAMMAASAFMLNLRRGTWYRLPLAAAPVLLLLASPALRLRAHSIADTEMNGERIRMWRAGLKVARAHPLIGVGPGNAGPATLEMQNANDRVNGGWTHLHSSYVNTAAERGIPGLTAYLVLLGCFGQAFLRRYRRMAPGSSGREQALAGILTLIGLIVCGLTEATTNDTIVLMVYYFAFGLTLPGVREYKPQASEALKK